MEPTDWDEVYQRLYRPIFCFVYARTGDYEEAGDIVADTFVRAIEAERRGAGHRHGIDAWLWQVARNMVIDRYRWHRRRRHIGYFEDMADIEEKGIDPHAEAEASILHDAFCRAAKSLTHEQTEALSLYAQGYGQVEIGRILCLPAGTVKSRVHRAQSTLRLLIEQS